MHLLFLSKIVQIFGSDSPKECSQSLLSNPINDASNQKFSGKNCVEITECCMSKTHEHLCDKIVHTNEFKNHTETCISNFLIFKADFLNLLVTIKNLNMLQKTIYIELSKNKDKESVKITMKRQNELFLEVFKIHEAIDSDVYEFVSSFDNCPGRCILEMSLKESLNKIRKIFLPEVDSTIEPESLCEIHVNKIGQHKDDFNFFVSLQGKLLNSLETKLEPNSKLYERKDNESNDPKISIKMLKENTEGSS